jgi:hypothetical protein
MGYTVEKLLDIARKEIGYIEKETNANLDDKTANAGDNNWTKYARDLQKAGYYQAGKNGYAWCDMWVDWCHLQAADGDKKVAEDTICQTGLYGAGCEWSAKYYKQQGRFFKDGKVGDQIFFNNYAHTGIVEKIENGIVTTIEGNTSNKVARRTYEVGSSKIDGYGRPKYVESNLSTTVTTRENYKVGDIVNFTGTVHYATANASTGPKCKGGKAKITNIYKLGQSKHPYHLIRESGSGATVYGWVDEGTFTKIEEKKYYRVRKSWNDANSQVGAYESLDEAKKARENANPYHIYDWNGNEV